jgi:metallophosphoesterase (TIGR00282 family)
LGLVNVLGRVFMDTVDCPFETAVREVESLQKETPLILVDAHAEATAEKIALGWHLAGRCTAVVGTHTHVQTADERVLPGGTAYITDVGMTGPHDSVIGVKKEIVIERFLTGMPGRWEVSKEGPGINAVVIEADDKTGCASAIHRVMRRGDPD